MVKTIQVFNALRFLMFSSAAVFVTCFRQIIKNLYFESDHPDTFAARGSKTIVSCSWGLTGDQGGREQDIIDFSLS